MICDDCAKADAEFHTGDGICLCGNCLRNFDRNQVVKKMEERDQIIKDFVDGKFVPFDILRTLPVELLADD